MRAIILAPLLILAGACEAAAPEGPLALTPEGWGPLRIGMSRAEVEAAVGPPDAEGGWIEPEECDEFRPARAPEGLYVMILEGRLARISVRGAGVATERGIAPGAPADAVRRAYGERLLASPHEYLAPDGEYLTIWADGRRVAPDAYVEDEEARGLRFEMGLDRRVEVIHAGGPSIQYVEGCA